jgi:Rhs element Vgr protein
VYYHFTHADGKDKIIFIDTHNMSPDMGSLTYNPQDTQSDTIHTLTSRHRQLPLKVVVRDYDYQKPLPQPIQQNPSAILANVEAEAEVDPNGHGVVYFYGENFLSPTHGSFLAGIRSQELLCRKTQYFGESDIDRMHAGWFFTLGSSSDTYLITEITHVGSQTQYLTAGVLNGIPGTASIVEYKNSFTALSKTLQYRPERKTPKTVVPGPVTAFVESETGSSFAELDSEGRYKVRLPFDTDTVRLPGKGSAFIRMAQSHGGIAGNNGAVGAHFPLHHGTEVQLTFINGDPNRPIITGAVPCLNAPSPVTENNQTLGIIRDSYGNEIILDETPGNEHIRLHSPNNDATLEIGGGGVESYSSGDNTSWTRGNTVEVRAGTKLEGIIGAKSEFNIGFMYALKLAMEYEFSLTGSHKIAIGYEWNYSLGPKRDISEDDINSISHDNNIVSAGNTLCLIGGAGVTKVNDSTSIINANEQGIVLTVGNKKNPYEPGSDAVTKKLCLGAALASAVSTLLMFGASECEAKDEKGGQITTIVFSSLAAAVSVGLAGWYTYKLAKESNKVQLVEHDNPDTKIALDNDKITLERHFKNQGGQPTPPSSQIQLNDNVTIMTHANNDNQCVIELDNNSGLYLRCEKGAANEMVGSISINQVNGNIEISNLLPDSVGSISLFSNSDIYLNSDKENIIIQADKGDMEVNAKKFKWKGDELDFGSLKVKQ